MRLLLQKAIDTPVQSQNKEHDEFEHEEDCARARVAENVLKQSIHEANMKWHAHEDEDFRDMAGKYALLDGSSSHAC